MSKGCHRNPSIGWWVVKMMFYTLKRISKAVSMHNAQIAGNSHRSKRLKRTRTVRKSTGEILISPHSLHYLFTWIGRGCYRNTCGVNGAFAVWVICTFLGKLEVFLFFFGFVGVNSTDCSFILTTLNIMTCSCDVLGFWLHPFATPTCDGNFSASFLWSDGWIEKVLLLVLLHPREPTPFKCLLEVVTFFGKLQSALTISTKVPLWWALGCF